MRWRRRSEGIQKRIEIIISFGEKQYSIESSDKSWINAALLIRR
jgi:hypothetical protein